MRPSNLERSSDKIKGSLILAGIVMMFAVLHFLRPDAGALKPAAISAVADTSTPHSSVLNGVPVDPNTASEAQIAAIPGIGTSKAKAIVRYREKNGAFGDVDDLLDVPGIGVKTLASSRTFFLVPSSSKKRD